MVELNYDEIDVLIRPIIKTLNENGVATKFSCQGHSNGEGLYIMFEDGVQENILTPLLDMFDRQEGGFLPLGVQVKLYYWVRNVGRSCVMRKGNWMFEVKVYNEENRQMIINRMISILNEYYK